MLGVKLINIADNERGLLFKKNSLQSVLQPGQHRLINFLGDLRVETFDITKPELNHSLGRFLVTVYADKVQGSVYSVDIKDTEVGLVYQDGKLADVLQPGSFRMYWKGAVETKVNVIDISENFAVDSKLLSVLVRSSYKGRDNSVYRAGINSVAYVEVPDNHVGLMVVNGKLSAHLQPGSYGYWKFNRNIDVNLLDCRVQTLEVSGQEILTKDRVSLRINLSASYRIADTNKVATLLSDYADFLYRELQLALRSAVGTRSLDDLLADKTVLNDEVEQVVKSKILDFGLQVQSIGVKDIILPGEMKEILNQVVQAQKTAEANQIKRREETQATRSLHNTAKVMEGNPVLMRLKELEVLEKVTERIDRITVFGGLEGVLQDLVKIPSALQESKQ